MKNNQKIFETTCIKDYILIVMSDISNNYQIYLKKKLIFNKGDIVYYRKENDTYLVSLKKDYLYKLNYYHNYIFEFENDFQNYFLK